jgi:hypothetical protein
MDSVISSLLGEKAVAQSSPEAADLAKSLLGTAQKKSFFQRLFG